MSPQQLFELFMSHVDVDGFLRDLAREGGAATAPREAGSAAPVLLASRRTHPVEGVPSEWRPREQRADVPFDWPDGRVVYPDYVIYEAEFGGKTVELAVGARVGHHRGWNRSQHGVF